MQLEDIIELPVEQALSHYCTIRNIGELPTIVIDHPVGFVAIALQGAHLLTWRTKNQNEPVLWLSPKSAFKHKVPIRGGIPVCWPWFCDKYKSEPYHGFARISTWQLIDYQEDDDNFNITFSLKDNEQTRAIWPHHFDLSINFYFEAALCQIEMASLGEFENTAALHSYFNVGNIEQASIYGTGKPYDNTVDNSYGELSQFPLIIDREIGNIFTQPESVTHLIDHKLERQIRITHQHNSDVVIWNPWQNRAKAIEDFPDDGYKSMVCIETACANSLIKSQLNKSGKLGVKIEVEYLKHKSE